MKLLSEKELAKLIGRSQQSLQRDRRLNQGIPFIRFGPKHIRYREEDIQHFLMANRVVPGEARG